MNKVFSSLFKVQLTTFVNLQPKHFAFIFALLYLLVCNSNLYSANPTAWEVNPTTNNITAIPGSSLTFKIGASDADGNLKGCEWYLNGSNVAVHNISGSNGTDSWTKTFNTPGTYIVECEVFDSDWQYSSSVKWTVTVKSNSAPTAIRNSPSGSSLNLTLGDSQTFKVNGADVDGNLDGCEWYLDGNNVAIHKMSGSKDSDSWSNQFKNGGTYIVEAVVYDSKKKYSSSIRWTVNVVEYAPHPAHEFFDDFDYSSYSDNGLTNMGWEIIDKGSGSPNDANYRKENVTFAEDPYLNGNKFMILTSKTSNTAGSMELARIQSKTIFLQGTYAARVYFDDNPNKYKDGNVETFYTINKLKYDFDPDYSECDFEYLPYDVWGVNPGHQTMYLTTWETYQANPFVKDRAYSTVKSSFSGWHTLLLQATNGKTVKYYIDGKLICEHDKSTLGHNVYPETSMQIAFANWIFLGDNNIGLGTSPATRDCNMKVDWVYHAKDTELNTAQVEYLVNDFRKNSIQRLNTMSVKYTISTSVNPINSGTIKGDGSYDENTTITLSATPNFGYQFVNWTEKGNAVSTWSNYTFDLTSNRTLVANFKAQSFTITARAKPSEGGTVTGSGSYTYGETVTVRATTNSGYKFINWTENSNKISTDSSYSFEIRKGRTLDANFEPVAGVKNLISEKKLQIYPNPTSGIFTIAGKMIQEINILDINGKLMRHLSFSGKQVITINIQNLPKGIYYVRVNYNHQFVTTKVIYH